MASGQETNIRYVAVGMTDVGRIREHNEDNFLAVDLAADRRGKTGEALGGPVLQRGLSFVVADGMGGAAAGEVASQMAVDTLHSEFKNADLGGTVRAEPHVIGLLETAIHKANESIYRKGQESKEHQGMGTTLTAAVVLGDSLYLSQVGDSRGYILRKGKLVQMTRDQSLIGQLIEEGTLTEEQAEKLGGKNIILQALGVEETLKIDSKRYDILRGDTLLLCSDGLTGMVPDPKIEEILSSEADLPKAARKLIEAANAGGGKDNITCVLARFEGEGLREPLSPLGAAEKAGGAFHAPPPPKSKAGRNAVVATAAVLVLVALVLFWPKAKRVVLTAGPVDGTATLKPGSGADFEPEKREFKAGEPVTFKVGKGVAAELVVEAPGYRAQTWPLATDADPPEIPVSVRLVRIPSKSLDFLPPPYGAGTLARARVKVVPMEGQPGSDLSLEVKEGGAPEFAGEFPAGKWQAVLTRGGFRPASIDFEARSDAAEVVKVPALEEVFGDMEVTDLPPGARVTLLDEEEPLLPAPAEVGASRSIPSLKVRSTRVTVKAARDGYEFQDQKVEVKEGEKTKVSFASQKAAVSFTGPEGGSVKLRPASGPTVNWNFDPKGKSPRQYLAPGTYAGQYIPPEAERVNFELTLEPGQLVVDRDVSTLGK